MFVDQKIALLEEELKRFQKIFALNHKMFGIKLCCFEHIDDPNLTIENDSCVKFAGKLRISHNFTLKFLNNFIFGFHRLHR